MKKLLLTALVLSLAMGTALARQKGGPDAPARGGGDPVARLTEQLDLDADQVEAVTTIFQETKMLRDEQRDAFKEILCEIREDAHTQILAVLTPVQQDLFDEHRQKREEAREAYFETHPERNKGDRMGPMDCDS